MASLVLISTTMRQCGEDLVTAQELLLQHCRREQASLATHGAVHRSLLLDREELETELWFAQQSAMRLGHAANHGKA
jgi:hypothetical protein